MQQDGPCLWYVILQEPATELFYQYINMKKNKKDFNVVVG